MVEADGIGTLGPGWAGSIHIEARSFEVAMQFDEATSLDDGSHRLIKAAATAPSCSEDADAGVGTVTADHKQDNVTERATDDVDVDDDIDWRVC